jgi:hypothetical protein
MGFNLVKAVSRAVGLKDKIGIPLVSVLAPALVATDVAVQAAGQALHAAGVGQTPASMQQAGPSVFFLPGQSPASGANYYPPPTSFSEFGPSSYPSPPDFSNDFSTGEGAMPWDYSMPSPVYSTQPTLAFRPSSEPTQASFLDSLTTFLPVAAELL